MTGTFLQHLDSQPVFTRVITNLHHQEPDRVPLPEASVDLKIMGQFLGKPVCDECFASQEEFWTKAGYGFIPRKVGMCSLVKSPAIPRFQKSSNIL